MFPLVASYMWLSTVIILHGMVHPKPNDGLKECTMSIVLALHRMNGIVIPASRSTLRLEIAASSMTSRKKCFVLVTTATKNTGKVIDQVVNDINITINNLEKEGIDKKRIVIDPGFGFNKSIKQNIELHDDFVSKKFNNFPILIGTSKKSFLGEISNNKDIDSRTEISIASALDLKNKGANIFRMHDAILFKKIISYLDLLQ